MKRKLIIVAILILLCGCSAPKGVMESRIAPHLPADVGEVRIMYWDQGDGFFNNMFNDEHIREFISWVKINEVDWKRQFFGLDAVPRFLFTGEGFAFNFIDNVVLADIESDGVWLHYRGELVGPLPCFLNPFLYEREREY